MSIKDRIKESVKNILDDKFKAFKEKKKEAPKVAPKADKKCTCCKK